MPCSTRSRAGSRPSGLISRPRSTSSRARCRRRARARWPRARTAAATGLKRELTPVKPDVEQVVQALRRLPSDRPLTWRVETTVAVAYPASEGDLIEMLGNLVDNARKWARGEVRVAAAAAGKGGFIVVEDDGPGMSAAEAAAIARGRSDLGGLCAAITWAG